MAYQFINVGTAPNDNTGDTLRNAFLKVNNNFSSSINTGSIVSSSISSSYANTASYILNAMSASWAITSLSSSNALTASSLIYSIINVANGVAGLDSNGNLNATVIPLQDTFSNLSSVVPASGEPVYATDTNLYYIGNGTSSVANLYPQYFGTSLNYTQSFNNLYVSSSLVVVGISGSASNSGSSISLITGNGGNGSSGSGGVGGVGGNITLLSGRGGDGGGIGNAAGTIIIKGGIGGNSTFSSPGTQGGGQGGSLIFIAGDSGNTVSVGNNGSSGASCILAGGKGGDQILPALSYNGGNGGNVSIYGGLGGRVSGSGHTGNTGSVLLSISGSVPMGNVGIRNSSPVNPLDVTGNISCSVITASLFNGINIQPIMQAGSASIGGGTSQIISFVKNMPNTSYVVMLTAESAITSPYASGKTVNGFTASFGAYTGNLDWMICGATQ